MTRCEKHDKTWTGLKVCHCEECGEMFLTVRAFDAHRVGPDNNRRCDLKVKDKSGALILHRNERGVYHLGGAVFEPEKVTRHVRERAS